MNKHAKKKSAAQLTTPCAQLTTASPIAPTLIPNNDPTNYPPPQQTQGCWIQCRRRRNGWLSARARLASPPQYYRSRPPCVSSARSLVLQEWTSKTTTRFCLAPSGINHTSQTGSDSRGCWTHLCSLVHCDEAEWLGRAARLCVGGRGD